MRGEPCPVLYWLSGQTRTEQNFIIKAGAQAYAALHGLILVAPDISPCDEGVADDPAYDLELGAGFYLNATQDSWAAHYRMLDYVAQELQDPIERHFPNSGACSISGHFMGGHGALVTALRNPGRDCSVSAFSPIVAPSRCPGSRQKAFAAYLGDGQAAWTQWDEVELIRSASERLPLLVIQGLRGEFLDGQLRPDLMEATCRDTGHPLTLHWYEGYNHSYYLIVSFIDDHVAHHANALR